MRRFLCFFSLCTFCCGEDFTAQEVFNRARDNVARQLSAVSNYTCVLTVHRTLYFEPGRGNAGCAVADRLANKLFMQDRLRLDVAVSEGNEIFSWHGGSKFSSAGVSELVKSGPISSGSFVGYLHNILFTPGVAIHLNRDQSDRKTYVFEYSVPLKSSAYQIHGRKGSFLVPYHGSFAVHTDTFNLQSLSVNTSDIPRRAEVCTADTEIAYQNVDIAGKSLLIPKSFALHVLDANTIDTVSNSEYTDCREFRGESTVRFDFDDSPQGQSDAPVHDQPLPAGMRMHVRLLTPIDDHNSFTGDPVQGVLLQPLVLKNRRITIPKGAIVSGVLSRLELRYQPTREYIVAIHWDRLAAGPNTYLLNANAVRQYPNGRRFGPGYSGRSETGNDSPEGTFILPSNHFRMDQTFTAYFENSDAPKEAEANGNGR
jgi:hypothetical protein